MPGRRVIYTMVLVWGATGAMADDLKLVSGESLRGRVVEHAPYDS